MKYSLISLGCPKNQVDSESLLASLEDLSEHDRTDPEDADVILINTCSFIESAKAESVETILNVVATGKRVLVMGCLPARYMRELKQDLPEVEAFFGVGEEERILEHLGLVQSVSSKKVPLSITRSLLNPSHYAYLKIAEGCDNRCTYCAIPSIRGPYISRTPDMLVAEAEELAKKGVKELIVVAQDTTAYGKDLGNSRGEQNLDSLLRMLSKLDFRWIRIMYAYPDAITDSLLDFMQSAKNICSYLDIPLQHSEPSVLLRMGRRSEDINSRRIIEKIRGILPNVAIRSSFIVGFPGETEKEFEGLLDFIRETKLERVGAFMFSKEEGTPAAAMKGQIPKSVMKDRLDRLMGLQAEISYKRNLKMVGSVKKDVLIDECDGNTAIGRTSADAPDVDCNVIIRSNLSPGDFVKVRITGAQDYDLLGSVVGENPEIGVPNSNIRNKIRNA